MEGYTVRSVMDGTLEEARTRLLGAVRGIGEEARSALEGEAVKQLQEAEARLEDAARRLGERKEEVVLRAEAEAKAKRRAFMEGLIRDALARAQREIASAAGTEGYGRSLLRFVEEGLGYMPKDQDVLVYCNERDKRVLGGLLRKGGVGGGRVRVSDDIIDCLGGVVMKSADGSTLYDSTIETRMRRLERELRFNVMKILTGQR